MYGCYSVFIGMWGDYLGGFRVIGGEGGYLGVGKSFSWICSFISNSGLGFM